jgi:NADH-quinone oxidoreductase subunit C
MDQEQHDKILAAIKETFEDEVVHAEMHLDFFTITLKETRIIEVIRFLFDDHEMKFQYLTTLCGIHYPEIGKLAVMYQLHNLYNNMRIRLKVFLPENDPVIPSLTPVFAAANWMERETYDFYGIRFTGHPNLQRILNVDDMIIFPMRKEFPLEDQVREDKNDHMFGR